MIGPTKQSGTRLNGIIRAVYIDGALAPSDGAGTIDQIRWDVEVETQTGFVILPKAGTYCPAPDASDYMLLANDGVYKNKRVDVIETGDELEPMIPVFPAYEDCA